MSRCPTCGAWTEVEAEHDEAAELLAAYRRHCADHGHHVLPGDRVPEHVAAELLGRAPGTLRNWAGADRPLRFSQVRRRRTYRLDDIAAFALQRPVD
ncbi:MAG: helix-turn-helix domain-containing protein [Dokdonella sp.]|nr:helix-turn-helix domain-containing protein [Dokdonella sp.]